MLLVIRYFMFIAYSLARSNVIPVAVYPILKRNNHLDDIPEIIEHGVNGFISNDEEELKQHLVELLNDEDLAKSLGKEARKTIVDKFSQEKFVLKSESLLHKAAKICFRG